MEEAMVSPRQEFAHRGCLCVVFLKNTSRPPEINSITIEKPKNVIQYSLIFVSLQQVQKWERSGTNPTVVSLDKISRLSSALWISPSLEAGFDQEYGKAFYFV
jgi:transcriptional regulator with XRE-family HTH domain